jgi:c-di-GMP-binding flagellar brake protein YcgR
VITQQFIVCVSSAPRIGSVQEKRRIQRVSFESPIQARLGTTKVRLYDLSTTGARIEHRSGFTPGGSFLLTIEWQGEQTQIRATVTRCKLAAGSTGVATFRYQCGLRFGEMNADAKENLHRILAWHVESSLATDKTRGRKTLA